MSGARRAMRMLASTFFAMVTLIGGAGHLPPVAAQEAITITDVKGRTVTVEAPPERVVCLVSLCEDMLLELGMRPVARTGELLEHPVFLGERASEVPQVPGGFLDPDVEAIIGYEPDLVIGLNQTHDGLGPALEGVAPLWLIQSDSLEDSIQYLRDLGTLTGRTAEATEAERQFRDKLAEAEQQARKDLTALVVFGSSDGSFTIATGSYLGELLERLFTFPWEQRGQVIGASTYSVEEIVANDADVLFVMTYKSDPSAPDFSEVLVDDPLWGQLTAVRSGAVHEVSPDLWGNGRGTRSLGHVVTEALELVNASA